MRTFFLLVIVGLNAFQLQADSLILQSGQSIQGVFLGGDSRSIRFESNNQVHTYNLDQIRTLTFQESSQTDTPRVAASSIPEPSAHIDGRVIPAGTQIQVRLIENVDSKKDAVGRTYRASLDKPLAAGTDVLAPTGSDVLLRLESSSSSGRITGRTSLELAIESITIGGETYAVASSSVSKTSGSRTTKSAEIVGGVAGLGTLLGAIAGGGKGAAIGALSGAAAGTTAQIATSGERVRVPSETRLIFTLSNAVRLKGMR